MNKYEIKKDNTVVANCYCVDLLKYLKEDVTIIRSDGKVIKECKEKNSKKK